MCWSRLSPRCYYCTTMTLKSITVFPDLLLNVQLSLLEVELPLDEIVCTAHLS